MSVNHFQRYLTSPGMDIFFSGSKTAIIFFKNKRNKKIGVRFYKKYNKIFSECREFSVNSNFIYICILIKIKIIFISLLMVIHFWRKSAIKRAVFETQETVAKFL